MAGRFDKLQSYSNIKADKIELYDRIEGAVSTLTIIHGGGGYEVDDLVCLFQTNADISPDNSIPLKETAFGLIIKVVTADTNGKILTFTIHEQGRHYSASSNVFDDGTDIYGNPRLVGSGFSASCTTELLDGEFLDIKTLFTNSPFDKSTSRVRTAGNSIKLNNKDSDFYLDHVNFSGKLKSENFDDNSHGIVGWSADGVVPHHSIAVSENDRGAHSGFISSIVLKEHEDIATRVPNGSDVLATEKRKILAGNGLSQDSNDLSKDIILNVNANDGVIIADVITIRSFTSGSGYINETNIPTSGGTGSGLTVACTTSNGVIQTVSIVSFGEGYLHDDVLTISGGTSGTITLDIDNEADVTLRIGGSAYTVGKNVTTSGGSGTGLTVDYTVDASGKLTSALVNNYGQGYVDGNTVSVDGGTSTSSVTLTVDDVPVPVVLSNGTGYTVGNDIATSGGSGTGMRVNYTNDVNGAVGTITISSYGTGYLNGDLLTIQHGLANDEVFELMVPYDVSVNTYTQGTGYTVGKNVPTSGGTGSGLTVDYTVDEIGELMSVEINTIPASHGYTDGDAINISGSGLGTGASLTFRSFHRNVTLDSTVIRTDGRTPFVEDQSIGFNHLTQLENIPDESNIPTFGKYAVNLSSMHDWVSSNTGLGLVYDPTNQEFDVNIHSNPHNGSVAKGGLSVVSDILEMDIKSLPSKSSALHSDIFAVANTMNTHYRVTKENFLKDVDGEGLDWNTSTKQFDVDFSSNPLLSTNLNSDHKLTIDFVNATKTTTTDDNDLFGIYSSDVSANRAITKKSLLTSTSGDGINYSSIRDGELEVDVYKSNRVDSNQYGRGFGIIDRGVVTKVEVDNGGRGYAVGDVLLVTGLHGEISIHVTVVSASAEGEVTEITYADNGLNHVYSVGPTDNTTYVSGSSVGNNLSIFIAEVASTGAGEVGLNMFSSEDTKTVADTDYIMVYDSVEDRYKRATKKALFGGRKSRGPVKLKDTGGITSVLIEKGGIGYSVGDVLTVAEGNDGIINVDSVDGVGKITSISIHSPGTNYVASVYNALHGSGSDCEIEVTSATIEEFGTIIGDVLQPYLGQISSVTVAHGGSGYAVNNTIILSDGNTVAQFKITSVSSGGVVTALVPIGTVNYRSETNQPTNGGSGSGLRINTNINQFDIAPLGLGHIASRYKPHFDLEDGSPHGYQYSVSISHVSMVSNITGTIQAFSSGDFIEFDENDYNVGGTGWRKVTNGGGVQTFNYRAGNVVPVYGDYDSVLVKFTPTGHFSSTSINVQSALEEVDSTYVHAVGNINESVTGIKSYSHSMLVKSSNSPSSPAVAFSSEANTGMYRESYNNLAFSTDGTKRLRINNNSLDVYTNQRVIASDATVSIENTGGTSSNLKLKSGVSTSTVKNYGTGFSISRPSGQVVFSTLHADNSPIDFTAGTAPVRVNNPNPASPTDALNIGFADSRYVSSGNLDLLINSQNNTVPFRVTQDGNPEEDVIKFGVTSTNAIIEYKGATNGQSIKFVSSDVATQTTILEINPSFAMFSGDVTVGDVLLVTSESTLVGDVTIQSGLSVEDNITTNGNVTLTDGVLNISNGILPVVTLNSKWDVTIDADDAFIVNDTVNGQQLILNGSDETCIIEANTTTRRLGISNNGSQLKPSLYFDIDIDTGLYSPSAGRLTFVVDTVPKVSINSLGLVIDDGSLVLYSGSVTELSTRFSNSLDTGLCNPIGSSVVIVNDGVPGVIFDKGIILLGDNGTVPMNNALIIESGSGYTSSLNIVSNGTLYVGNDVDKGCGLLCFNATDGNFVENVNYLYTKSGSLKSPVMSFTDDLNQPHVTFYGDIIGNNVNLSGMLNSSSDKRLKNNFTIIGNALEKVTSLTGYTYDRTDIETDRQTGLIAQEVQDILPEAVSEDDDGMLAVAYGNMVGLLVESIKELKSEIDNLKQEITDIKNK